MKLVKTIKDNKWKRINTEKSFEAQNRNKKETTLFMHVFTSGGLRMQYCTSTHIKYYFNP